MDGGGGCLGAHWGLIPPSHGVRTQLSLLMMALSALRILLTLFMLRIRTLLEFALHNPTYPTQPHKSLNSRVELEDLKLGIQTSCTRLLVQAMESGLLAPPLLKEVHDWLAAGWNLGGVRRGRGGREALSLRARAMCAAEAVKATSAESAGDSEAVASHATRALAVWWSEASDEDSGVMAREMLLLRSRVNH
jgi:hypothetical protein